MAKTKNRPIAVRVSPTIAADYKRRQAFPTLRSTGPYRPEGTVTYQLPRKGAVEILDDAKAQHRREFCREERGLKKAYRALIDMIEAQVKPDARSSSAAPIPVRTCEQSPPRVGRLTLADITNRRVQPSGLIVEDYLPRFRRYEGTSKQIVDAGVLPAGFKGFPRPHEPGKSWCSTRWEAGHFLYSLSKKYVSCKAWGLEDASADYWEFEIFDDRYTFTDYLDRRAA